MGWAGGPGGEVGAHGSSVSGDGMTWGLAVTASLAGGSHMGDLLPKALMMTPESQAND